MKCTVCSHEGPLVYYSAMLGRTVCDDMVACRKRAAKAVGATVTFRQAGGTWLTGTITEANGQHRTVQVGTSGPYSGAHRVHVSQIHAEGS